MATDERARRGLQEALVGAIGPEPADTLLTYLPPAGWADVATTRNVQALGIELRGEMAELRGELRGEMAALRGELRAELADLRGELRGDMADLRGELRSDMADLRGALRSEMAELRGELTDLRSEGRTGLAQIRTELHHELRVQFFWMVTLQLAVLAAVVALLAG